MDKVEKIMVAGCCFLSLSLALILMVMAFCANAWTVAWSIVLFSSLLSLTVGIVLVSVATFMDRK